MTDETEKKVARNPVMPSGSFNVAEAHYGRFSIKLKPEFEIDDLLIPGFWANVTRRLSPGAIIEVRAEDLSFYGEYFVKEVAPQYAIVERMRFQEFGQKHATSGSLANETYQPKWMGPGWGWCLQRASDLAIIEKEFPSRKHVETRIAAIRESQAA